MAMENVYNMSETGLFYCAQPNKTLVQGKICGRKMQQDSLTLTFVVSIHTFYNPLASWASPYFSRLDLAIVGLAHLFEALDLAI